MIEASILYDELNEETGNESKDFELKTKRSYPSSVIFSTIISGIVFSLVGIIAMFILFLNSQKDSYDFLLPLPFIILGIGTIVFGLYRKNKNGSYFVGTPNKLVICGNDEVRSIQWKSFTGEIEVKGKNMEGDLFLKTELDTEDEGHVVSILGITEVFRIAGICNKRIREHSQSDMNMIEMSIPSIITLPGELSTFIGDGVKNFSVRAGRTRSMFEILIFLIFGTLFLIASAFSYKFDLMPPFICFSFSSCLLLYLGTSSITREGAYFVGTPLGLITYYKNRINILKWEIFKDQTKVNGNSREGSVYLKYRNMMSMRNDSSKYRVISMINIPNAPEISEMCQRLISNKEDLNNF